MIKKFGCKNIKAIKEYSEIEIRPVTVVMGENSSGKSSLLQALSLLNGNKIYGNNIKRIKYNNPFSNFETNNTFKNKGESVFLHFELEENQNKYNIELEYKDEIDNNEYGYLDNIRIEKENHFSIKCTYNKNSIESEKYSLLILNINNSNNDDALLSFYYEHKDKMLLFANLEFITATKHLSELDEEIMLKNISSLNNLFFQPIEILINHLTDIRHIGMLKDANASYDYENDYIGYFGERYKEVAKSLSSKAYINKCLKNIFQYEIKKIDKDTGDFYLSDDNIDKSLTLNMFGSSVSSTIPILTQYAKNREKDIKDKYRLTIIEEPEINEHPLSQAKFIESLFPKNRPKNHFNIIETHSDHIVNKLRYLVSQKIIKSNEIVIYYKHKNSNENIDKNKFYKIEIDKCGQFISDKFGKGGFPKGFFDATLDELFMLNNEC